MPTAELYVDGTQLRFQALDNTLYYYQGNSLGSATDPEGSIWATSEETLRYVGTDGQLYELDTTLITSVSGQPGSAEIGHLDDAVESRGRLEFVNASGDFKLEPHTDVGEVSHTDEFLHTDDYEDLHQDSTHDDLHDDLHDDYSHTDDHDDFHDDYSHSDHSDHNDYSDHTDGYQDHTDVGGYDDYGGHQDYDHNDHDDHTDDVSYDDLTNFDHSNHNDYEDYAYAHDDHFDFQRYDDYVDHDDYTDMTYSP